MATTNYSWNLPTVGGSENTWGTQLNANWTALDTLLGGTSATEFAILDGATVTTTEVNYLSGVTSGIQSQINSVEADKAEKSITLTAGTGLTGGGDLSASRTFSAVIADQDEAEAGTISDKLMTPLRTNQAIQALVPGGIGDGQTWQNVGGSRSLNTTYTNSTGKPIMLNLVTNSVGNDTTVRIRVTVDGTTLTIANESYPGGRGIYAVGNIIIPIGSTYSVAMDYDGAALGFSAWHELR